MSSQRDNWGFEECFDGGLIEANKVRRREGDARGKGADGEKSGRQERSKWRKANTGSGWIRDHGDEREGGSVDERESGVGRRKERGGGREKVGGPVINQAFWNALERERAAKVPDPMLTTQMDEIEGGGQERQLSGIGSP